MIRWNSSQELSEGHAKFNLVERERKPNIKEDLAVRCCAVIKSKLNGIEGSHLPSIDFFGVSAETGLIVESDLEDGAERASVLAGITVHANVILAAVVGMGVTAEGSGGDVTSGRANESTSNFCDNQFKSFLIISIWIVMQLI